MKAKSGKKDTKHKMNLQDNPFKLVKKGTKTIELRLYDEKRQKINIGDIIEFNNNNSEEIIKVKVISLHLFKNFEELYKNFDKVSMGYKENEMEKPTDMSQYYRLEDINKYGVVGIEIKKM